MLLAFSSITIRNGIKILAQYKQWLVVINYSKKYFGVTKRSSRRYRGFFRILNNDWNSRSKNNDKNCGLISFFSIQLLLLQNEKVYGKYFQLFVNCINILQEGKIKICISSSRKVILYNSSIKIDIIVFVPIELNQKYMFKVFRNFLVVNFICKK